jgi:putative N6-adenine-specific DNA methylase
VITCTCTKKPAGPQLHKRGYRAHISEAPLRETLAAAVLRQVGLHLRPAEDDDKTTKAPDGEIKPLLLTHHLWDPMCGSGTIAIEAASQARGLPAVVNRRMAFESWPTHPASDYQSFLDSLTDPEGPEQQPGRSSLPWRATGSDIKSKSIASARANAQAAGVGDNIDWVKADFLDPSLLDSVARGTVVIANMPYGKRLDCPKSVIRSFEKLCGMRPDLHLYAIVPRNLPAAGSSSARKKDAAHYETLITFDNRGIPVRLVSMSGKPPSLPNPLPAAAAES